MVPECAIEAAHNPKLSSEGEARISVIMMVVAQHELLHPHSEAGFPAWTPRLGTGCITRATGTLPWRCRQKNGDDQPTTMI